MKTNRIDHALLALMAIALAVLPFYTSGYVIYVVNLLLVFVVLALGLHLVIGETGQFALSHAAFYGVGIYTAGLINNLWHPPFFVSIVAGGLLAALMGYVIGALALRMRDIYLALSTFAFGEAMQWVFLNWDAVTNGSNGFRISPATLFGYELVSDIKAYPFVVLIAALLLWTTVLLSRSQLGSAFRAVRERRGGASHGRERQRRQARGLHAVGGLCRHRRRHVHAVRLLHPSRKPGLPDHHPDPDHGGGGRHRLGARRHRRRADLRPDLGTAAPGAVVPGNHLWRDSHGLHDVRSQGAVRRPPGRAPRAASAVVAAKTKQGSAA